MSNEPDKKTVAQFRLDKARRCNVAANKNLTTGDYESAANRAYYCVFHAMRAVLALDDYDAKKHSGIIAEFRRRYIKNGVFPDEMSDIIAGTFNARGHADYEDFYFVDKDAAGELVEEATKFLDAITAYLETRR
ncbi:DNA-binding protein [Planctomycetales bacterium]|nr:DNA-binding protein [Planctomycetales bacterium]